MLRASYLLVFAALTASATTCIGPSNLGDALLPGMVVFIGQANAMEEVGHEVLVTFEVDEVLWGIPKEARTVKALRFKDYVPKRERLFFAFVRDSEGKIVGPGLCGPAFAQPVDHPWVQAFRDAVERRTAATLPILVQGEPTYAPIDSARIVLQGPGGRFAGETDRNGLFKIRSLRPGAYKVSVVKPGYSQTGPTTLDVLPGAAGRAVIRLRPNATISGRILDHQGRPVTNSAGWELIGLTPENDRDYRISQVFSTGSTGEFRIPGVMPGRYLLAANAWGQNHPKKSIFPQVFYPGTLDMKLAVPFVISEGTQVNGVTFRLPDFGGKRILQVRVIGENGEAVPETLIENGPARLDDRTMAAIAEVKTDARGIARLEIWKIAEYSINARWVGNNTFRQSSPVSIPPGEDPVSLTIKLPRSFR